MEWSRAVGHALRALARLLAEGRRPSNQERTPRMPMPPLTVEQILAWADDHKKRRGDWPGTRSGRVLAAPAETWVALDRALRRGGRGLPPGEGLAGPPSAPRGGRNKRDPTPLSPG